jgi:DNA-binding response OmpR family regulator
VRVVRLRKKLAAAGAPNQPITAVRNVGYQLSVRVELL